MNPELLQSDIDRSINTIKSIWTKSTKSEDIFKDWKSLSVSLKTDKATVEQIETELRNGKVTKFEILHTLVSEWKSRTLCMIAFLMKSLKRDVSRDISELIMELPPENYFIQDTVTRRPTTSRNALESKRFGEQVVTYNVDTNCTEIINKKSPERKDKETDPMSRSSYILQLDPLLSEKHPREMKKEQSKDNRKLLLVSLALLAWIFALILIWAPLVILFKDNGKSSTVNSGFILVQTNSGPENTILPSSIGETNTTSIDGLSTGNVSAALSPQQECFKINAGTFDEYKNDTLKLSKQKNACVNIYLSDSANWDSSAISSINQSPQIASANFILSPTDDNISVAIIVLSGLTSLQQLRVQSSSNNCSIVRNNSKPISVNTDASKQSMRYLTELVFENVGSCSHVMFEMISSNLYMPRLKMLTISNGEVDSNNLEVLQQLLKNVRYSVEKILLPELRCSHPLIQNDFEHILSKVYHLQQSTLNESLASQSCIDNDFYKSLPNIRTLILQNSVLSWSQYITVLKLEKLETLEMTVEVPSQETFSCKTLVESLRRLKNISIRLIFANPSNCTISEIKMLRKIRTRKLFTKCVLSDEAKHDFGK